MELPPVVSIRPFLGGNFLRYVQGETYNYLMFVGETLLDPNVIFEVEKAKNWDGLIHIKSRTANKYLVRPSPDVMSITASADAPDEDKTRWTCTLFKPSLGWRDFANSFALQHVQLDRYVSPTWGFDVAGSSKNLPFDLLVFVDREFVSELPKHVAFKADNDKYLGTYMYSGKPYLQFSYDNPNDLNARHEIFQLPDGCICIKSNGTRKFWRAVEGIGDDGDFIAADADYPQSTNDTRAMFRPKLIDVNRVTLENMNNSLLCKRSFAEHRTSCLRADAKSIHGFVDLKMVELDWKPVFGLLKHVAFKGDNDKYLGTYYMPTGFPCLQFSFDNPKHPSARHEIFHLPDGCICIKSVEAGKFWTIEGIGIVVAVADDPRSSNYDKGAAMFRPRLLGANVVALQNMKNSLFCKRFSGSVTSCLRAYAESNDEFAVLKVVDLDCTSVR